MQHSGADFNSSLHPPAHFLLLRQRGPASSLLRPPKRLPCIYSLSERLEATAQWFLFQASPGLELQVTPHKTQKSPPYLQVWVEKETDTNSNLQNNIFLSDLVLTNRTLYSLLSLPLIYALQLLLLLDLLVIKKHYVSEIPNKPRWLTQKGRAPNSSSSQGRWGPMGRTAASQGPGCSVVLGSCSEAQYHRELQAGFSASQGDN